MDLGEGRALTLDELPHEAAIPEDVQLEEHEGPPSASLAHVRKAYSPHG